MGNGKRKKGNSSEQGQLEEVTSIVLNGGRCRKITQNGDSRKITQNGGSGGGRRGIAENKGQCRKINCPKWKTVEREEEKEELSGMVVIKREWGQFEEKKNCLEWGQWEKTQNRTVGREGKGIVWNWGCEKITEWRVVGRDGKGTAWNRGSGKS